MKFGFIGAGKVGFSLGKFFVRGGIQLTGYYSRQIESAREAALFTGTKYYDAPEVLVRESDALFLTVPDGNIAPVFQNIKGYGISDKLICHCSGAMTAEEAFCGIGQTGAYGYSVHPLFPVSNKTECYRELSGAFFCLEGNGPHIPFLKSMLESLGAKVKLIQPEVKIRYHAACVISSNFICALVQESLDLLEKCGFSQQEALQALTPLIRGNLEHIIKEGPSKALTGPVERCDINIVRKHMDCLGDKYESEIYRSVSEKIVEIAAKKNPMRDYTPIKELLKQGDGTL